MKNFGTIGMGDGFTGTIHPDCKGVIYPGCKGIMMSDCKGIITTGGERA